jgi:hypothetical protein
MMKIAQLFENTVNCLKNGHSGKLIYCSIYNRRPMQRDASEMYVLEQNKKQSNAAFRITRSSIRCNAKILELQCRTLVIQVLACEQSSEAWYELRASQFHSRNSMSIVTPQDPTNDDQTVAQVQRKKATESQLTAGIYGHQGKQLGVGKPCRAHP